MPAITPTSQPPAEKLEPIEEIEELTLEQLAAIDFSEKPESLRKLDAELLAAELKRKSDPHYKLYCLMYKSNGPVESVLFESERPLPVNIRDAQVWCRRHGYRYISVKKAYVNILDLETQSHSFIANTGDVTDLVTRQSRIENQPKG